MKDLFPTLIISFLLLFSSVPLMAQENETKRVLRLNLLSPGFEFEDGKNKTTLSIMGALGPYVTQSGKFQMRPAAEIMLRNYINFERRESLGKNIKNFSGDFIGLNISYFLAPINNNTYDNSIMAGVVYGVSRTYESSASILLMAGVGYLKEEQKGYYGSEYSGVGILLGIRFGFAVVRDKS